MSETAGSAQILEELAESGGRCSAVRIEGLSQRDRQLGEYEGNSKWILSPRKKQIQRRKQAR